MNADNQLYFLIILIITTSASLCCGDDAGTYISTRATYYGSPDCLGTPTGACGYGEYGRTVNDGQVSGVSRLYRNGTGCGACYQVRCKIPSHCNEDGARVVVTDYGEGDNTDFILSARAYATLARPNMAAELFAYGVIDVEFQRVPCQYSSNLMFKVHERSRYPNYLAIVAMYQGGLYDITQVEVWQEDCKQWRSMRRVYGAVWDDQNPARGVGLNLRVQATASTTGEVKLVQLANVIPSNWKAGLAYDTSIQLN